MHSMSHSKEERIVRVIVSVLMICILFVSGCASMFNGTKDTLYVRSNEPDTTFFCNNREIGKGTSAIVTVPKKDLETSRLRAEKVGCREKTTPIVTQFDATTLLGILIDYGLISILVVDFGVNGATTKAKQTEYILTPECTSPSQQMIQPAVLTQPPAEAPTYEAPKAETPKAETPKPAAPKPSDEMPNMF